jgi:hypothetical protein
LGYLIPKAFGKVAKVCLRAEPRTYLYVLKVTARNLRMVRVSALNSKRERPEYKSGWLQQELTGWVEYLLKQYVWNAVIVARNWLVETTLKMEAAVHVLDISTSDYDTTPDVTFCKYGSIQLGQGDVYVSDSECGSL